MSRNHPPFHYPEVIEPQALVAPLSEQQAIDAIVASQKANSEPIDPNGAKRFVRALIAVGLFKASVRGATYEHQTVDRYFNSVGSRTE